MEKNVDNIVVQYELGLCQTERDKLDALIADVDNVYNRVNSKLRKIYTSKAGKDGKGRTIIPCHVSKEERADLRNMLLFSCTSKHKDKETGEYPVSDIHGFTSQNLVKLASRMNLNTKLDSRHRNAVITNLGDAWVAFINGFDKNGNKIEHLPKNHTKKNQNEANGFSWNVGATNYRRGDARTVYSTDKEKLSLTLNMKGQQRTSVHANIILKDEREKSYFYADYDVAIYGIYRKTIRGKVRYYLMVTYQIPKISVQPIDESLRVGIDPNLNNIAIYSSQTGCHGVPTFPDDDWYQRHTTRLHHLQNRLSMEDRKANPNCYKEDTVDENGNVKLGVQIKGRRHEVETDKMKMLKQKISIEHRRITEYRKNHQGYIVNQIISEHPSVVKFEDNDFAGMTRRSKTGRGRNNNKKRRYGKQIGKAAIANFKTLLEQKCNKNGINFCLVENSAACTQFDCTNGEKNKEFSILSNRVHQTSDGRTHSRDLISAYNVSCCGNYQSYAKKFHKTVKQYATEVDKELAKADYEKFCQSEEREIGEISKRKNTNALL